MVEDGRGMRDRTKVLERMVGRDRRSAGSLNASDLARVSSDTANRLERDGLTGG